MANIYGFNAATFFNIANAKCPSTENIVTTNTVQTITAQKTFTEPILNSIVPTNGAELCNKTYVDSLSTFSGTITMYGGITAPSGYLLCNGNSYSIETYPALYAVIGRNYTGFSIIPQYFQVPDMRGIYAGMPGTNTSSNYDLDLTGLVLTGPTTVGAYQMQQTIFLNHNHTYTYPNNTSIGGEVTGNSYYRSGSSQTVNSGGAANPVAPTYSTIGDVLRPTTLGVNYIIKT